MKVLKICLQKQSGPFQGQSNPERFNVKKNTKHKKLRDCQELDTCNRRSDDVEVRLDYS